VVGAPRSANATFFALLRSAFTAGRIIDVGGVGPPDWKVEDMAIMRRLTADVGDRSAVEGLFHPDFVSLLNSVDVKKPADAADAPVSTAAAGEDSTDDGSKEDPGRGTAPTRFVVWAIVIVGVGSVGAWLTFKAAKPDFFAPKSDYSVFAGLFIAALALERLLEPFSKWLPPDTDLLKAQLDRLVAQAERSKKKSDLVAAADKQAELDRARGSRAVLLWATASVLAMFGAALLGLFLLRSVVAVDAAHPGPNRFLDLFITGLAVGAGTKPLHELTSSLTVAKENSTDPAQTAGG
jgi:hypothetical protein